ncbi:hypothetical protein ACT6QH_04330 [Xanthobacter sp. TB0139]|uniref:hypothetical protein n=1 Tax=Xanthobacter sp. TB0139 TaxID=3459178 RepID=UPI0040392517
MQKALKIAVLGCFLSPFPAVAETGLRREPSAVPAQPVLQEKAAPPSIQVVGRKSIYSREEIARAIAAFRAYCQPLGGDAWNELTNITARITPEFAPERQAKGWKTSIHLAVTLPRETNLIPADNRKLGKLGGRTLYFFMGGASGPGVFVNQREARFLCGMDDYQTGATGFIPILELDFLNR